MESGTDSLINATGINPYVLDSKPRGLPAKSEQLPSLLGLRPSFKSVGLLHRTKKAFAKLQIRINIFEQNLRLKFVVMNRSPGM